MRKGRKMWDLKTVLKWKGNWAKEPGERTAKLRMVFKEIQVFWRRGS